MFHGSITWVVYVFVVLVLAAAHNDSRSITGSDPEVTVHHLTTGSSEHGSWTPASAAPTTTMNTTTTTTARPPARPDGAAVSPPRMTTMAAGKQVKEAALTELGALLDAGPGTIVMLAAGNTRLVAHRAILADRSPVFAAMFSHSMAEDSSGEVPIHDMEGPVLRQLLAFMYTQQAPQLSGTTPQLLAAAHNYGVTELKAQCEQQLAAYLTVENVAAAAVLAVRYSCSILRPAAIAFIKAHVYEVIASQGWAEAMLHQAKDLTEVSRSLYDLPAGTRAPATTGSSTTTSTAASYAVSTTAASTTAASTTTDSTTADSTTASTTADSTTAASTTANSTTAASTTTASTAAASTAASVTAPRQPHSLQPTPPLDEAAVSRLRNLSPEEKGRRLIQAARQGKVSELRALLAAGADVGARDRDLQDRTALHGAAKHGHVQAVRCLLEAGADVGARSSSRYTPLHDAAVGSNAAVVRLLVAWRANVNARSRTGDTPLHRAAYWGAAEAAAALLEMGADRRAKNKRGETPLDIAREENERHLIRMLS